MKAPEISEKDILIAKLFKKGTALFGSQEKFNDWINSKNAVLDGKKPTSYLDTCTGIQFVLDELNAIEFGFSA